MKQPDINMLRPQWGGTTVKGLSRFFYVEVALLQSFGGRVKMS